VKKTENNTKSQKVIVDVGYGYIKTQVGNIQKSIPANITYYSYSEALQDALARQPELLGFRYDNSYYSVGGSLPSEIRKERWDDPIETAVLISAGLVSVNAPSNIDLVILAPVGHAYKKQSLLSILQPEKYLPQVLRFPSDEPPVNKVSAVDILPQPMGLAYQSIDAIEDRIGIIVIDIGMGTTDVMSFLVEEGMLEPEWDRAITHTYKVSGTALENMLMQSTGRSRKIIRKKIERGQISFTDEQKAKIEEEIVFLLRDWENDKEDYLVVLGGGGAYILLNGFPEIEYNLQEKYGWTTTLNTNPFANVEGIYEMLQAQN